MYYNKLIYYNKCSPLRGEDSHFDKLGWNHQVGTIISYYIRHLTGEICSSSDLWKPRPDRNTWTRTRGVRIPGRLGDGVLIYPTYITGYFKNYQL